MGKIAGIKGKSLETYPPDNLGQPPVATTGSVNPVVREVGNNGGVPLSILFLSQPIHVEAAAGDVAIVMFTGTLSVPLNGEVAASLIATVTLYLNNVPVYAIPVAVTPTNSPIVFNMFFRITDLLAGSNAIDVRADTVPSTYTVNSGGLAGIADTGNSIVVMVSPY